MFATFATIHQEVNQVNLICIVGSTLWNGAVKENQDGARSDAGVRVFGTWRQMAR